MKTGFLTDNISQKAALHMGIMLPGVLKLYGIVTALSLLAFIYGLVDSFGGLMYSPDYRYILDLEQTQRQPSLSNHPQGPSGTKDIGS